jgi:hypothetical protein
LLRGETCLANRELELSALGGANQRSGGIIDRKRDRQEAGP